MPRTFIAVCLDEPTREAVGAEIERLKPLSRAVAWVPPQNLHLTLKFLGDQSEDNLTEVLRGLEEVAAERASFDLTLHGLGAFPGMERPRILWIGVVEGGPAIRALQSGVEAALERRQFPPESRPWHPHLTIGRVFDPRRWQRDASPALRESIARAATTRFGTLAVSRVALMRSDLHPSGARYSELRSVAFSRG
ncbi:MAG TPA: RNA 2',3'-cyclic phosphodiesterase [Candidatus Methylomirabilis sp.]|nr:RNA 2',3'-cyclic phosphodiesterase [Candidatus Methylomirabilis sp.]